MTPEDLSPAKKSRLEVPEEINTDGLTLEVLENEPGFYQSTIRSMLSPGHEGELCTYLKEMGLIQRSVRCQGSDKSPNCTSPMKWTQARNNDKYTWKCGECSSRCSIRESSFFKLTKCSFMNTIRAILAWCKDIEPENTAKLLNAKVQPIKKLYELCSVIVEDYVKQHPHEWRLGGANSIVLVDVYPEGYFKLQRTLELQNNNSTAILCITQAKTFPPQYWFHVLSAQSREAMDREIIDVIRCMVRPETIIVCDPHTRNFPYMTLCSMKQYKTCTVEQLSRCNRQDWTILKILDEVWKLAIEICDEAQMCSQHTIQTFLYNQLWRRRYAVTPSSALEYFLHHIADHYPLSRN